MMLMTGCLGRNKCELIEFLVFPRIYYSSGHLSSLQLLPLGSLQTLHKVIHLHDLGERDNTVLKQH